MDSALSPSGCPGMATVGDLPDGSAIVAACKPFTVENRLRGKSNFTFAANMFAAFKPLRENNSLFQKRKSCL